MSQTHRYKEIQLAQLRSFCLAATEGNFTSAAKALGLSASTVWQQVRALERELKAKLLHRRGGKKGGGKKGTSFAPRSLGKGDE